MHTSTDGSPEATAPEHSPAGGLPAGLVIALIVAASLLTLSVFLPWATWHSAFEKPKPAKHFEYGTQATGGEIVVLAGMAALTLAFIVRAVSHRFAGYTVVPGVLSLVAIGQYGFTYRQVRIKLGSLGKVPYLDSTSARDLSTIGF